MLGTEKLLITEFVDNGDMQMIYWPVLNHGQPSVFSTLTAFCAGWQDAALFWIVHDILFENQSSLWRADRDFYVQTAVGAGVAQADFEACYDNPDSITHLQDLDQIRRDRGIFGQPVFDINGTVYFGAAPFDIFAGIIRAELPDG